MLATAFGPGIERPGVRGASNSEEKLSGSDELARFVRGVAARKLGGLFILLSFVTCKSVKDLEFLSLRWGGLRVACPLDSNAFGLCNALGESIDERHEVGLLTRISTGAIGSGSFS